MLSSFQCCCHYWVLSVFLARTWIVVGRCCVYLIVVVIFISSHSPLIYIYIYFSSLFVSFGRFGFRSQSLHLFTMRNRNERRKKNQITSSRREANRKTIHKNPKWIRRRNKKHARNSIQKAKKKKKGERMLKWTNERTKDRKKNNETNNNNGTKQYLF